MPIDNTFESIPLRDGHVSSYDPATHTARVVFEDHDNLVSPPFPVLLPNTLKNKDEIHLDPGEHVMCLCFGNGIESGVVLGCVYDGKNPPQVGEQGKRVTVFDDGTRVEYDRAAHVLLADVKGVVKIVTDGGIGITGNVTVAGSITASGSIVDGGGNTNHHSH
jgi:phage baseplate assembly protein gpV